MLAGGEERRKDGDGRRQEGPGGGGREAAGNATFFLETFALREHNATFWETRHCVECDFTLCFRILTT